MRRYLLLAPLIALQLSAFSTTNIQYLYGNFEGPTFLDTQSGPKHTITMEHYRTWDYGDIFTFFDYVYAKDGLRFTGKKHDLYGEFSPRISLNKLTSLPTSSGLIKEYYLAYQYNRSETYIANLYGIGSDLNIPGFQVFGLNFYRKIQNIGKDTYQLSGNYYASITEQWHFEGFTDWTTEDFLSQNQLLFNIGSYIQIREGKLDIGTEWHYYHENNGHTDNNVFQAMIKYTW
ncbi:MAG: outer membrane protein OmpK [Sulfuricurvum sp.]|nr:outer membrane protein OmpK [Sulfuricurvum sp.]